MKKEKETSTDYMTAVRQGMRFALLCILFFAVPICSACASSNKNAEDEYAFWKEVGVQASFKAVRMIWAEASRFNRHDCLALTNAGYAEIDGRATTGALDGLTRVLRVGRGNHTLVELQSASTSQLRSAEEIQRRANPLHTLEAKRIQSVSYQNFSFFQHFSGE